MSLSEAFAKSFAQDWLEAWNARDLDAILAHYTEDVLFHSPRIKIVTGRDDPSVMGKAALRTYWARAIDAAPHLHFRLLDVFVGSDAITVLYENHRVQRVAETFIFDASGAVCESIATYVPD